MVGRSAILRLMQLSFLSVLKGPMVAKGYWNNPEVTQESFIGGFWRSGDIGRMDAEGFVYVLDRRKDMLNRCGYKTFSIEVENTLVEHPDLLKAGVVARPCPVLGERVHVFVSAREGRTPDPEALRRWCSERLSDYKVRESFKLCAEPLPRNAAAQLSGRRIATGSTARAARDLVSVPVGCAGLDAMKCCVALHSPHYAAPRQLFVQHMRESPIARQAVDRKVSRIGRGNTVNLEAAGQPHQTCIAKVHGKVLVLVHHVPQRGYRVRGRGLDA